MSNLTIDQILNDIDGENFDVYDTEKQASAPTSSFSSQEIEEMAELLKSAAVMEPVSNPQEKIAEALLLSTALDVIEDAEKFQSFRKEAMDKGHSEEEVDAYIEKQASMSFLKNLNKRKILMGLGMGIGGASAGAGGYYAGKEQQKEKTKGVGQAAFKAGRLYQHGRELQKMQVVRNRIADYFARRGQRQG